MIDALIYQLKLDALDDHCAIYEGPNKSSVVLDRATFNGQGMPITVYITVPGVSEKP